MPTFAQCGRRAYRQGELAAIPGWWERAVSAGVQALPEQVVTGGCEAGQPEAVGQADRLGGLAAPLRPVYFYEVAAHAVSWGGR